MDEPDASEEYLDVRNVEGDPLGEFDEMSEGNDGDCPYGVVDKVDSPSGTV